MPCHLLAYYDASVDGSSAYTSLSALTDPFCAPSSSSYTPPRDLKLLVAAVGGIGITAARLQSTALAATVYPHVTPIDAAVNTSAPVACDYTRRPPNLAEGEPLDLAITNAGANPAVGLALCGFDCVPAPPGQAFWIRYSLTGTVTAAVWDAYTPNTPTPLDWEQNLAAGAYAVIGMEHWSATAMAARLVLPGYTYRPGVRARSSGAGSYSPLVFRTGELGVMGWFTNRQMPGVEVLCSSADVDFEGRVLVVRAGGPEMLPAPR